MRPLQLLAAALLLTLSAAPAAAQTAGTERDTTSGSVQAAALEPVPETEPEEVAASSDVLTAAGTLPWARAVLWHPTGPWQPIPPGQPCHHGITHPTSQPGGTATEHQCRQRLHRPVTAIAGPWRPATTHPGSTDHGHGKSGGGRPHASVQHATDSTALNLTRSLTIGQVEIRLSQHQLWLYDPDGRLLAIRPISAGKPTTPTPAGTYRVQSRSRRSVALVDRRIHLEHMVRFNGAIGFHGIPYRTSSSGRQPLDTPLGTANVSLGCVRLDDADAAWLYNHLADGKTVHVTP